MAGDGEAGIVRLFDGDGEQISIKWDLGGIRWTLAFIPGIQRDLDEIRTGPDLRLNRRPQLIGICELARERDIGILMSDPRAGGVDMWRGESAGGCRMGQMDVQPVRRAHVTRAGDAAAQA